MNFFFTATVFFMLLVLNAVYASASWLIEPERFHVSAHGQISCQECHADIADKSLHPDPAEVNKSLSDFYRLEQCITCHEDVLEDIDEGSHGGEQIADEPEFKFCIGCHDPHYQLAYLDSVTKLDLTQPVEKKCSICHELQRKLPEVSSEDEICMSCHRFVDPDDSEATDHISNLCFRCHGKKASTKQPNRFPLIDTSAYNATVHTDISCITCHLEAIEFEHINQELGDCRQCHYLHAEQVAHDTHLRVSCEACHLNQVSPAKATEDGKLQWQINRQPDEISAIHAMVSSSEDLFCRRCHFDGNTIGAAAMILPAKSVMCMPCHAATFSAMDATTLIALIIFGLGVLGAGTIWFSGSLVGAAGSKAAVKRFQSIQAIVAVIFSSRIFSIIKVLVMDGLLQRRLFRASRIRWFIHAFIFFPFLVRFCWGLTALAGSIWLPEWRWAWVMLDKNHPLTALVFDLTGVLAVSGVVMIMVHKYVLGPEDKPEGLPKADWSVYGLMGGIIIFGFILEGMRIAMTGTPEGSPYAFLGYVISRLFNELNLTEIYGYVWYVHAILTGAFVAYLPFSRMFHMIMAPVSLAIYATSRSHGETVQKPVTPC
jgi:nitrate reductase gamma subunit